jgi:hypothetical protein
MTDCPPAGPTRGPHAPPHQASPGAMADERCHVRAQPAAAEDLA